MSKRINPLKLTIFLIIITAMSKMPFEFVLEALLPADPEVKQMFGCHAIYIGEKIVLVLRDRPDYVEDNGVWIATDLSHHQSLLEDFPAMRSITVFGPKVSNWQVLPVDADDFEESTVKMCELLLKGDQRIGRIPKKKKKTPRRSPGR